MGTLNWISVFLKYSTLYFWKELSKYKYTILLFRPHSWLFLYIFSNIETTISFIFPNITDDITMHFKTMSAVLIISEQLTYFKYKMCWVSHF